MAITIMYFRPVDGSTVTQYYIDYPLVQDWSAGDVAVALRFSLENDSSPLSVSITIDGATYSYPDGGIYHADGSYYGKWVYWFRYTENPTWGGWSNGTHTTSYIVETANDGTASGSSTFTVNFGVLAAPTTPTPADASGPGINFTNRTLSWVNGGGADTYTVRIGPYPIAYNVVSQSQAETYYVIPEEDVLLYKDNPIVWRVDAEAGGVTVTGDTWTFDPRPAKTTTPSPADEATSVSLNLTSLSWAAHAYTDSFEVNCSWSGSVSPIVTTGNAITLSTYTPLTLERLGYGDTYTWSVDAVNEWGTTEGDEWTFGTRDMNSLYCSWENYDGKTLGPGEGVEGVDYYYTGTNCMSTVLRVVAFAGDRVWIKTV